MDEVLLKNICGWIGACLLIFFFISPIVPILQVIRKLVPLKDIPIWLYITSLFDSLMWGAYSFYINELPSIVPNLIGVVCSIILMTVYWIYYSEFVLMKYLIINGVMYVCVAAIISICYVISFHDYRDVIGYIAAIVNILLFASPGQKVIQVFKTGNYELIAIVSSVCGVFCGGFWLVFGILINNVSIIASNSCGFLFALFQVIIYVIFRLKRKSEKSKGSNELIIQDKEAIK